MSMLNKHEVLASEKLGPSAMHPLLWTERGEQRTPQTASTLPAGLKLDGVSAPEI